MSLALNTLRLGVVLEQLLKEFRDSSELNQTQVMILFLLSDPPQSPGAGWFKGAATPSAISRGLGCARAAIAMQIAGLQRVGLIELVEARTGNANRVAHGFDGRTKLYRLTAAGMRRAGNARLAIARLDEVLRVVLTAKGRDAASGLLRRALKAFGDMPDLDGVANVTAHAWHIERLRRKSGNSQEAT